MEPVDNQHCDVSARFGDRNTAGGGSGGGRGGQLGVWNWGLCCCKLWCWLVDNQLYGGCICKVWRQRWCCGGEGGGGS